MIDLGLTNVILLGYRYNYPHGNGSAGSRVVMTIHVVRFACGCVGEHDGLCLAVHIYPGCPRGPHRGQALREVH